MSWAIGTTVRVRSKARIQFHGFAYCGIGPRSTRCVQLDGLARILHGIVVDAIEDVESSLTLNTFLDGGASVVIH